MQITKEAVLEAIELAKERNCWAITDNVEITIDEATGDVIVWNGEGDYDAWYKESDIEGILNEARSLEAFYNNPTRKAVQANNDWAIRMGVTAPARNKVGA